MTAVGGAVAAMPMPAVAVSMTGVPAVVVRVRMPELLNILGAGHGQSPRNRTVGFGHLLLDVHLHVKHPGADVAPGIVIGL